MFPCVLKLDFIYLNTKYIGNQMIAGADGQRGKS